MVGIIRFDREQVLDRAMMTFWRSGFEGTSIQDLEAATRLGRGSLYNTFGDKQGLFIAGLGRYWDTIGLERMRALSHPDPFTGLEGYLRIIIEQMGDINRPRGCLFTNTALECPSAPEPVLRFVAERTRAMESAIHSLLQRAHAERRVEKHADLRALARFYLGIVKGIGVLHKVHCDTSMLTDIAQVAMSAWPHPAPRSSRTVKAGKHSSV